MTIAAIWDMLKTLILSQLSNNRGRIISIAAAFLVSTMTAALTHYKLALDPVLAGKLTVGVGVGVGWLIDAIVLTINGNGIRKIQEALPESVKVDKYAGAATVAAVQDAAAAAETAPTTTTPPL